MGVLLDSCSWMRWRIRSGEIRLVLFGDGCVVVGLRIEAVVEGVVKCGRKGARGEGRRG